MKALKIYLLNVCLFIVLFAVYYTTAFLLGYGSNDNYVVNSWLLYLGVVIIHLVINFLFISKPKSIIINHFILSSLLILSLYGVVAYIFR